MRGASGRRLETPCKVSRPETSSSPPYRAPNAQHPTPNAPGATPPHTQRPTPNAQHPTPWRPPNAPKMNLRGSLRQREGCFRTTYRGASQSIPSGDLVVAAGRGIQRLTPNTQRPPTPSKQMLPSKRPTPGRPCRPSRVAKIQACHPHKRHPHKPQCQSSLLAKLPPRPGVTLPSAWNRK